jgi:hypothetical protein
MQPDVRMAIEQARGHGDDPITLGHKGGGAGDLFSEAGQVAPV